MSVSESLQAVNKLLDEVVWCGRKESRLNIGPAGEEVRIIKRREDELRNQILHHLHELEHNAFDMLFYHFSKKPRRPLAPEVKWYETQYAARSAWGISVISQYLDESYSGQIKELIEWIPTRNSQEIQANLKRALTRIES